jgi:hypothetical protein
MHTRRAGTLEIGDLDVVRRYDPSQHDSYVRELAAYRRGLDQGWPVPRLLRADDVSFTIKAYSHTARDLPPGWTAEAWILHVAQFWRTLPFIHKDPGPEHVVYEDPLDLRAIDLEDIGDLTQTPGGDYWGGHLLLTMCIHHLRAPPLILDYYQLHEPLDEALREWSHPYVGMAWKWSSRGRAAASGLGGRHYLVLTGEPTYESQLVRASAPKHPELSKAVEEDLEDPRYRNDRAAMDGLEDVSCWGSDNAKLVVTAEGRFFAKIDFIVDTELRALRVMYLYCAGWRRRSGIRGPNPSSAEIVWSLAARHTKDLFGEEARLFVFLPRDGIYSALRSQRARQWTLAQRGGHVGFGSALLNPCPNVDETVWGKCAAELSVARLLCLF